jgi:hypothetical protein
MEGCSFPFMDAISMSSTADVHIYSEIASSIRDLVFPLLYMLK